MNRIGIGIGLLLVLLISMAACQDVEKPTSLIPTLVVTEAVDISRNEAQVSCSIVRNGEEMISTVACYYGTTLELGEKVVCDPSLPKVVVSLSELSAGTTYYYCFEVGNDYSRIRSDVYHFTTEPNRIPTVGELKLMGKGPTSAILQFDLEDDGGKPVQDAGFYVQMEGGEETRIKGERRGETFYVRLTDLQIQADYMIQGYAVNDVGETRTDKVSIRTEQAIKVVEAGSLGTLISGEERYRFLHLAVSGPLNGTDFRILREMMGRDVEGRLTEGRMNRLDLTDVSIVAGGDSYDGSHYTRQNVVSNGLFANCLFLKNVKLPYGTVEIESGAFENCTEMDSLYIPVMTSQVVSSKGCHQLKYIDVAKGNERYASNDGCLYSKDYSTLYWWPMGKVEDGVAFPEGLKKIGAYAFQQTLQRKLEIPHSVKELGIGAFYGSKLVMIALPENVTYIPTALFQKCLNLSTVYLGKEVSFLSAYWLDGCSLEHLYVPVKSFLPICHENAFAGAEHLYETCVLHVPVGSKSLYQSASPWKNFKLILDDVKD